jgi:prepilin-type N-terminal cleavage/methylation domain-containing protein
MNAMPSHVRGTDPAHTSGRPPAARGRRRGFTITELLVVIGVIVLLVALLLVALDTVQDRAKTLKTQTRMEGFGRACDSFQIDQGFYPGVVPEEILANDPQISGTENAILHLMGGFVREEDDPVYYASYGGDEISFNIPNAGGTYRIKVDLSALGEGPIVDGQPHTAYYTPGPGELGIAAGQWAPGGVPDMDLPDLIDAWGQPIGYIRQVRSIGPLTPASGDSRQPQFYGEGLQPYTRSTALGEYGLNQTSSNGNLDYSIFNGGADPNETLAQILRHPAMGAWGTQGNAFAGSPRGAYYLFSPGIDGIFFSRKDGPGTPSNPIDDITLMTPKVVEEYDDVVVAGGG